MRPIIITSLFNDYTKTAGGEEGHPLVFSLALPLHHQTATITGASDNRRPDSSTHAKNDNAARRYPPPRSTILLFSTQQGGVCVHLLVVHVFDAMRRYLPPQFLLSSTQRGFRKWPTITRTRCEEQRCCEEVPTSSQHCSSLFDTARRCMCTPPRCVIHHSCFQHDEEVPTSLLCRYSCSRHDEEVPTSSSFLFLTQRGGTHLLVMPLFLFHQCSFHFRHNEGVSTSLIV